MHTRSTDLAAWLRERVLEAGARGLLVGLNGSVNSTVVARLCQMAMPDRMLAVFLSCNGDRADEAGARLAAVHFGIPLLHLDVTPAYERLLANLAAGAPKLSTPPSAAAVEEHGERRIPAENLKSRMRMASLYFLANTLDYLVAGTSNRSELSIGRFTKYGDGGVDLLPLGDLLESEVLAIARDVGVPQSVLDTAGTRLHAVPPSEADRGFTYAELERYLDGGPEAVAPAVALRIERLMRQSEHKRRGAPTPESDERPARLRLGEP
jgi:NAD+ synthase